MCKTKYPEIGIISCYKAFGPDLRMTSASTTPGAPAEPGHFATSEDLHSGESDLKLASSHLSQTPRLWYLLCYLFMPPYDFLPFRPRRCSQSQSYKSFREQNSTSSGLQMFNRSTAQHKLLLVQVRWIIFWWCRCCWRLKFHSQLFCGFASEGEHLGAVPPSQYSSSAEEGWLVTTTSQNWPTLVKQLNGFETFASRYFATIAARSAHVPTYTYQRHKAHSSKKTNYFFVDCRQVWLVPLTQKRQVLQVDLSMWKERRQLLFPFIINFSSSRLSAGIKKRKQKMSCQHTPTRCMIRSSLLYLFLEQPHNSDICSNLWVEVCVHTPSSA